MGSRGPQQELRIDPEDGQPRTFEELRTLCMGRYTEQQIQEYWDMMMVPHAGEAIHNVANDPFLTHPSRVPRLLPEAQVGSSGPSAAGVRTRLPPSPSDLQLADVREDPFLTSNRSTDVANVREDPFLTHAQRTSQEARETYNHEERRQNRRMQMAEAAVLAKHRGSDALLRLIGPGSLYREPEARSLLIFGPWLLFMWVALLWCLLRHFSGAATVSLVATLFLCCLGMMFAWYLGRRGGPVSLLALGTLCLIATTSGTIAGNFGWNRYWRQYWWMRTGFQGGLTSANTPAGARSDYSVIQFAQGDPSNYSRVDHLKAAGYKDTDYYCVAPILSQEVAQASLVRVNYWAVGINCCQRYGSFTCDGAREWRAGTGVVMLEGGLPCPTCNNDQFRAAVAKAEAVHGLVSASGALFVRWVEDPSPVARGMLLRCASFIFVCGLLGGGAFNVLGWTAWYYGLGIQLPDQGGSIAMGGLADAFSAKDAALRKQFD